MGAVLGNVLGKVLGPKPKPVGGAPTLAGGYNGPTVQTPGYASGLLNGLISQNSAPEIPVAPTLANSVAEVDAATAEQRRRSNAGRASTILTGGEGVTASAPTKSAALLGMA